MNIPSFDRYQANVLAFLNRCAPGPGVYDEAAWAAAGIPRVLDPRCAGFIVPPERREVRVRTLADRCRDNDWRFASTPGGVESVEAGHSAVETLFLLGELGRLSPQNRNAWVACFNRYQDEDTGYYSLGPFVPAADHPSWKDPAACSHTWEHMQDHLLCSLCPDLMLLGGKSKVPLSQGRLTGRFLDREYLRDYLTARDWNAYAGDGNYRRHNPWYVGNEFWHAAAMLWQITQWEAGTPAARQARRLIDEVWYAWHDRNFGVNGFWYGEMGGDPARYWRGGGRSGETPARPSSPEERFGMAMAAMGAAHQLWFYGFENHPIRDSVREVQTDNLLALQNRHHGRFGMGDVDNPQEPSSNCTDVDCMTVLASNHRRQDYRRADIEAALHRAACGILADKINAGGVLQSQPGAAWSHCFNSVPTFSPADQGNLLDQSFYLWAVVAACSVLTRSDDTGFQTFVERQWPQPPSHWLWTPARPRNRGAAGG